MSERNEMETKSVIVEGSDLHEITMDECVKITFPLLYDFKIFPVNADGSVIQASSIEFRGAHTIINVPRDSYRLKLKMIKPGDDSYWDPTGTPSTPGSDENGDGFKLAVEFVDWFMEKRNSMDKDTQNKAQVVKSTRRTIIIRKDDW